jgi:hypothetical protein
MLGIKVHIVACGDAVGSGGRNNTCFVIDDDLLMTHLGPEMINSSETFEIEHAEDGRTIGLSDSTA